MNAKTEWSLSEFNSLQRGDNSSILILVPVYGLFGDKPLPEQKMNCYELHILIKYKRSHSQIIIANYCQQNGGHFVQVLIC